jgi:hypothetical protein
MYLSYFLGSLGLLLCCRIARASAYDVLTNHNNAARTGLVSTETILTPANVSGLKIVFQNQVDGQVYAQPLAVTSQLVYTNGVSQGKHNIVIVATEHDSVYAKTLSELYNSGTLLGAATKFAIPTVFEGRVYLGTATSLFAFGL